MVDNPLRAQIIQDIDVFNRGLGSGKKIELIVGA
jgi:hypothetical protein